MSEAALHRHRLRVRYGETDQMGRVHHANYLLYMEEARTGMMRELGASYAEVERSGIGLPVRKADLRYRAAALYEDELEVQTTITRVGPASITFGYRVERLSDGALIATGSTELACIELGTARLVHLPEALGTVFKAAMDDPQAGASGSRR